MTDTIQTVFAVTALLGLVSLAACVLYFLARFKIFSMHA